MPGGAQHHYLGAYAREEDAARSYDIAVRKFRGKEAPTNLPPRPGRPPQPIKPTRGRRSASGGVKQVRLVAGTLNWACGAELWPASHQSCGWFRGQAMQVQSM